MANQFMDILNDREKTYVNRDTMASNHSAVVYVPTYSPSE